ncbi:MAG: tyrosine-type recombinase/integrase [Ilumatobacteraceae bacterium]
MASKTQRRPYSSGCILSTGPGSWMLRVSVKDPRTSKRRQLSRRVSGTRTQAEAALNAFKREVEAARPSALPMNVTLNELIRRYFERGSKLATGTRRTYESLWHKWIEEGIGTMRAADVAAYHYVDLWNHLQAAGLSRSTMNSAYALIKGSYRAAAKYDEFTYNSARFEAPPRPEPYLREHVNDATLIAIMRATDAAAPYWPFLVRLALATGCRRGELAAMRWNALDDDGWLSVRNSVDFHEGEMVLSNTKNDQPRTIALDDETATWWREEHERADALHLDVVGRPMSSDAFVFAGEPTGSKPMRPDALSKQWRALCDEVGVGDVEFREMRNWHATTLDIDFDYSLESIGRRLGHSQARSRTRITQRYITTMKDRDRRMAADISKRLIELVSR